jgi:hypothetical protein
VTHGDVTDDVWETRGSLDGKDEITPVIRMFVTRNGASISGAGDTASFGEVYDAVHDEVMPTSRTSTNPTRTSELMVSVKVKDFGARARGGGVRKGGLRETKDVVNIDDELVARESVVRLGAGNDSDPGVSAGTKFSLFTFENGGEDRGKATGGLLRVNRSIGVGEMFNASNVVRGCSIEGLWRHKVWMIWLHKSREDSLRGNDGGVISARDGWEKICCRGKDYSFFEGEVVHVLSPGRSTGNKHLARIVKALEEGMARGAGVVYTQEITIDVGMQGGGADVNKARSEAGVEGWMCNRLCSSEAKATLLNGVTHLSDCTKIVGIRGPVHGETEVVSNGTHEGLITRKGEGVGEVMRKVA